MKKSLLGGLIAIALTAATSFAYASDGISSGSPPGLIASSIEKTDLTGTVNFTKATPALAFHSMGTKSESPAITVGTGCADSKADKSWAQAQASPGGGFALVSSYSHQGKSTGNCGSCHGKKLGGASTSPPGLMLAT